MEDKFLLSIKEELRRRGYKLTEPRLAIIEYMIGVKGHPGVQEIYEGVKAEMPGIGIATVYRTIDLFCELGILRALTLRNDYLRYELNRPDDHHHHLVCKRCGCIIEFGNCNFRLIAGGIEEATQFIIKEHNIKAYGFCPQCISEEINYSTEKM